MLFWVGFPNSVIGYFPKLTTCIFQCPFWWISGLFSRTLYYSGRGCITKSSQNPGNVKNVFPKNLSTLITSVNLTAMSSVCPVNCFQLAPTQRLKKLELGFLVPSGQALYATLFLFNFWPLSVPLKPFTCSSSAMVRKESKFS